MHFLGNKPALDPDDPVGVCFQSPRARSPDHSRDPVRRAGWSSFPAAGVTPFQESQLGYSISPGNSPQLDIHTPPPPPSLSVVNDLAPLYRGTSCIYFSILGGKISGFKRSGNWCIDVMYRYDSGILIWWGENGILNVIFVSFLWKVKLKSSFSKCFLKRSNTY